MSATTEILNDLIYPAIFDNADNVFPEHKFIKTNRGWKSQTRLFGGAYNGRSDKTVISDYNIGRISEWGEPGLSIWDYVQQRDSLSQQEALLKLSEMAGIALPSNLSPEDLERLAELNRIAKVWEDANTFFIDCLSFKDSPFATTARAQSVRDYLKGRGYSSFDFRLPGVEVKRDAYKMEVGYIPSIPDLMQHLIKLHNEQDVRKLVKLDKRIGEENLLTIPYRDPAGRIRGFAFRIIGKTGTKYLYSTGLQRKDILFNLTAAKRKKDIVIVESQIDAMLAIARGMQDVVALGGSNFNADQAKEAIKRGATKFTLALDNDEAGRKATLSAINVLAKFDKPVFIAEYPEGIKDADQLIIASGIDAFKEVVQDAKRDYFHLLNEAIDKILITDEIPTDKQVFEIVSVASAIAAPLSPIDRDIFINQFLVDVSTHPSLAGITSDALAAAANDLKFDQDKANQATSLKKLLQEATATLQKGDAGDAINLLEESLHAVKGTSTASKFKALFEMDQSEAAIRSRLQATPEAVKTGYQINIEGETEDLQIPAGVLSFIAAPTGHGKTSFLINTGLNIVREYADRNIYLLTFEESAEKITGYCLNSFADMWLNKSPNYRRLIAGYLKTADLTFFAEGVREDFKKRKDNFFINYIQKGRINIRYVDYDSDTLISYIEYIKGRDPKAVILIDYIQKMRRTSAGSIPNRSSELKMICEDLETCVNRTGLPVLIGAQFNREVLSPQGMHPTKLAESSDIEKTASEIWGLWNCAKEIIGSKGKTSDLDEAADKFQLDPENKELMILRILKSRSLPSGGFIKIDTNPKTGKIGKRICESETATQTGFISKNW